MSYIVLAISDGIQMSDIISKATAEIVDSEFPTVHVEDIKKNNISECQDSIEELICHNGPKKLSIKKKTSFVTVKTKRKRKWNT